MLDVRMARAKLRLITAYVKVSLILGSQDGHLIPPENAELLNMVPSDVSAGPVSSPALLGYRFCRKHIIFQSRRSLCF